MKLNIKGGPILTLLLNVNELFNHYGTILFHQLVIMVF